MATTSSGSSGFGVVSATETLACSHCALPVPAGLVEENASLQFCCEGCRTVFSVLHDYGLDRYYDYVTDGGDRVQQARPTGRSFAEFDDPTFKELYCRTTEEGLETVELYLEGVHCAACVWLVEKVPIAIAGVAEARLDLRRSMARVTWDPAVVQLSDVARFLDSLGYPARPFRGVKVREMRKREDRSLLIRIAVAGAAAGNVMLIAFALYGATFSGMEPEIRSLFHWVSMGITLPAAMWAGSVFFRGAWAALRTRTLHMDLPVAIGLAAGLLGGTINTVRGEGHIYFDSVTVLVFLLLVGRWVQLRQQRAASDAAELLYSLAPSTARVLAEDTVREVPVEALLPGVLVEVRAGDSVPADGVVTQGQSDIDASLLTGESLPVTVREGDPLHAGVVNLSARLVLRVERAGEATRVGRLMKMVEESARRRAPIVRMADSISGVFVAVVLALAAITAGLWLWLDPSQAVDNAVAVLIITCPCALGLATPLAVAVAVGRAARAGILVKGSDVVERLARPSLVLLDKTGTLTEGRTALVQWHGDDAARPLVRALEAESSHPVARALVAGLPAPDRALAVEQVAQVTGGGLQGVVDGRTVVVGSPAFVAERCAAPAWVTDVVAQVAAATLTPVAVAVDGVIVAVAGFGDPVRADARATIDGLRARGFRVGILSGDHPDVVRAVGAALGMPEEDCKGAQSPEDKLQAVERAARDGVVMVGDGVNDAAALAAATVGVAVHGGAEASLASADVFMTEPGLAGLLRLIDGARRTVAAIRRNLVFSLCYNVLGVALAMAGAIDPLAAAILMPLSSLTVVMSSYKARTFVQR